MKQQFEQHAKFVKKQFPGHTLIAHCNKLHTETDEMKYLIDQLRIQEAKRELVDVLLVAFSTASTMGMEYEEIKELLQEKIEINENREWEKQEDGTYQHK